MTETLAPLDLTLTEADPEIAHLLNAEARREERVLELIASENFTSRAVLEATGSVLTNKYAEGYPGKRYYGGCGVVDQVEQLAIDRAKALFGADHVNVQPHSGAQANMAVYMAVLQPGDVVLGMDLGSGGHLTHGSTVNFSGKLYHFEAYTVDPETELIDYDKLERQAVEVGPKLLVAGASSYPRIIDFLRLRRIADAAGCPLMVDMAHIAGLVAGGVHPSPVPHADFVTSTTHKTLRGPRGGFIMCRRAWARKVDSAVFPGVQGGPLEHVIAAKAVCFKQATEPEFREYARRVVENCQALARGLMARGFRLTTGGTDTHLLVLDVTRRGLTGADCETWLDEVGITVNKNAIPYDPNPPRVAGGVRMGTAALTTRGLGPTEMTEIAGLIADRLEAPADEAVRARVVERVGALCDRFPLHPWLIH